MRNPKPLPRKSPGAETQTILQAAYACHQQGKLAEAESGYRAVLTQEPKNFDALHFLGLLEQQRGKLDASQSLLQRAIQIDPRNPSPHVVLGLVLKQRGQLPAALTSYTRALALNPALAEAHYLQGNLLREMKRPRDALVSYDRALVLRPNYPEALNNRGNALGDLKCHAEALACYDQSLALQPNYFEALNNRGNTLRDLKRPVEALQGFDRALSLQPDAPVTLTNRGATLQDLRRHSEALDCFARAIALSPTLAMAHANESVCRLQLGDFKRGWEKFEWRWATDLMRPFHRNFAQPLWLGQEPLVGKTILLHAEQGLGDTLQFCRYAAGISALGGKVILEVQPSLRRLMAKVKGVDQLVGRGEPLPPFDCHCPLLSLPHAFGTELATIPSAPSYLQSDPALRKKWAARLGPAQRRRIGLVWSGSTTPDPARSIPLGALTPLFSGPYQFFGLQQEVRPEDQRILDGHRELENLGSEFADFADTAAVIELMDLVITVDTSVAHLAGALGKAVWALLLYNSDWRWLLDRDDSPWYPSIRLFRQTQNGHWHDVIQRVSGELMSENPFFR